MDIGKMYWQMKIEERKQKQKELETCLIPFCHGEAIGKTNLCKDHLWECYQKGGISYE